MGDGHLNFALTLNDLALLLKEKGDNAAAEPLFGEVLPIFRTSFGAEHPSVAWALTNLGELLQEKGDYAGAELLLHEALAIWEKALRPDSADYWKLANTRSAL